MIRVVVGDDSLALLRFPNLYIVLSQVSEEVCYSTHRFSVYPSLLSGG